MNIMEYFYTRRILKRMPVIIDDNIVNEFSWFDNIYNIGNYEFKSVTKVIVSRMYMWIIDYTTPIFIDVLFYGSRVINNCYYRINAYKDGKLYKSCTYETDPLYDINLHNFTLGFIDNINDFKLEIIDNIRG